LAAFDPLMTRKNLEQLAIVALLSAPLAVALVAHRDPPATERHAGSEADVAPVVEVALADLLAAPEEGEESVACPAPEVLAAPAPAVATSAMLLVRGGELVLSTAPDPAWGEGAIRSLRQGARFSARRRVAEGRLPPALAGLIGSDVVVHEPGGGTCVATVGEPALLGEEFGELYWEEDGATPDVDLNVRARGLLEEPLALVAALDGPRPCGDGIAWPADAAPPTTFVRAPLRIDEEDALRDRLRTLVAAEPEYAALRRDYRSLRAELPAGERAQLEVFSRYVDRRLEIRPWRELGGDRRLVVVELRDDAGMCEDSFYADARSTWLYEQEGDDLRRLDQRPDFDVEVLIDADHDGALEWLFTVEGVGDGLELGGDVDGLEEGAGLYVPFLGCPC
ncbi:MAG: hypothetical protein KC486_05685, partial [Myxococcales bacterium]|nr:hypothetical protein [Myxococcales bacterium]